MAKSHPWKCIGSKRTIWWPYSPPDEIMQYLHDMRFALNQAILVAEEIRRKTNKIPSAIDLRREIKFWFDSRYDYAKHHINPICRSAVAILKSSRKKSPHSIPKAQKLSMRIDSELFRIDDNKIRITLRPKEYVYIPINKKNKNFDDYSTGKISEILVTNKIVSLSFSKIETKTIAKKKMGLDLNFNNVVGTIVKYDSIEGIVEKSTSHVVKIQNDFSRRRKKIQKHVQNPQKRRTKLIETNGRQRNRVNDALEKLSSVMAREFFDTSFILEDLRNIRRISGSGNKKYRTYLNRWPYAEFQKMLEHKSPNKVIMIDPRGTSSECPVCGEKLKHPTWKISRCTTCDRDYDRDRLASLAISLRGLDLCGDPFPVSAETSLPSMMDEYLYNRSKPDASRTGGTEMAYVPNKELQN